MSAFYVGQRVRIVWTEMHPGFVGAETVITAPARKCAGYVNGKFREWLGFPTAIHPLFCPEAAQLEPIVDDGRKVVSWSDCLWQPEGIAA